MPNSRAHHVGESHPIDELEAFRTLRGLASGKLGSLPGDLIARHIIAVTPGGDWPVQRGALDALVRRRTFARRDGLQVHRRPRGPVGLGMYQTRTARGPRPYRTLVAAIDPLVGSCDCPDFAAGGLGLCKHMLVILDELFGKPRKWEAARRAGLTTAQRDRRLVWDPVRPLVGEGDWLQRVSWQNSSRPADRARIPTAVRRHFVATDDGTWTVDNGWADDPERRLALVTSLRRLVRQTPPPGNPLPHDPALTPMLDRERDHLRRRIEGNGRAAGLRRHINTLSGQLYPYQTEGVTRFLRGGRLLLADDMGLGKTVQAVAACHALYSDGVVKRGLLVVPAPLKSQWEREWKRFTDAPVTVVEGSPAQREAIYREQKAGFLITNYEQVLRDLLLMHGWDPELMVLDEAQRIKNWATKTATYIKRLHPPFRLVLTGTPMENRLEELASIMDWVDRQALEPKWRLTPWHATLCDGKEQVAGARNLNTLRARLAPSMLRRVRKEVLDQPPPRTDTRVPVELSAAQLEQHDELKRPVVAIMRRAKKRPLTQAEFLRLMQLLTTQRIICNGLAQLEFPERWPDLRGRPPGEATLRGLDSPKLSEVRRVVRELVVEGGQKVVIFSQWRRMLQLVRWALSDLLGEVGLRSAFFSGDESQKRRTQNIVDFHDDPTLAVLLSTDAGGVGLNLQRAASCLVNLELPWNPAVLEQRVGRIYRIGQEDPVQVYHLVSEGGIESRIAGLVSDKQALFHGLFDGQSNEVQFDGGGKFLDRVQMLVDPVEVPELPGEEDMLDEPVEAPDDELADDEAGDDELEVSPGDEPEEEAAGDDGERPRPPEHDRTTPKAAPDRQDDGRPSPSPTADDPPKTEPGADTPLDETRVRRMLAGINVQRTDNGGLRIEAEPEAATTLAAMFQGMADLLVQAGSRQAG